MLGYIVVGIATLLVGTVLVLHSDPSLMTDDTAQYISVAKHIITGQGIKTDLIYLQSHFDSGDIPAPQTAWPPGFSIAIAILAGVGIPIAIAPFVTSILAWAGTAFVIYKLAIASDASRHSALAACICWLLLVTGWTLSLRGTSEPLYVFFTTLSLVSAAAVYAESNYRNRLLFASGLLATFAFTVRYQGLFFICALIAGFAIAAVRTRRLAEVYDLIIVSIAPIAGVLVVFGRNFAIAGEITTNTYQSISQNLVGAMREFYWAVGKIVGIPQDGAAVFILVIFLVVLGSIGVIGFVSVFRTGAPKVRRMLVLVSGLYIVITLAALLFFTLTRTAGFFNERYLFPLTPFAILIITCGSVWLAERSAKTFTISYRFVATVTVIAILSLGQIQVLRNTLQWYNSDQPYNEITSAIEAPIGSETIRDLLARETSVDSPLLAPDGQYLGVILDRPVIGLPAPMYTDKIWDETEVLKIVKDYGVAYVVMFPELVFARPDWNKNRVFFYQLWSGKTPRWLYNVYRDESILVYAVDHRASLSY